MPPEYSLSLLVSTRSRAFRLETLVRLLPRKGTLRAPEGSVNFLTTTLRSTYCCLTSSPGPFAYMSVDLECIDGRAAICVSLYAELLIVGNRRFVYLEDGVFVESHCLLG